MALAEYKAKRDFSKTKEPAGNSRSATAKHTGLFVIQKHDATRLHYDFRLEMEGVLKSWAVPKGLPTAKGDRRLAVEVEDHPIEYADFEGTIPEGNYGAGTVMVWDTGTYSVKDVAPTQALAEGKLHFTLNGKKLRGDWTLVRMRSRGEAKPQWLLLKSGEDMEPLSERAETRSVVSRRTLDEIAQARDREWESQPRSRRRLSEPEAPKSRRAPRGGLEQDKLSQLPKAEPGFIDPMKALLVNRLPRGAEWIYEVKFDGVRALGIKRAAKLSWSRERARI